MTSSFRGDVTIMRGGGRRRSLSICAITRATSVSTPHNDWLRIKPRLRGVGHGLRRDEKLTTALLDRLAHHATVLRPRGRAIGCGSGAAETTAQRRTLRMNVLQVVYFLSGGLVWFRAAQPAWESGVTCTDPVNILQPATRCGAGDGRRDDQSASPWV